eukprot:3815639-Pyramimonas_sp.AAC.1
MRLWGIPAKAPAPPRAPEEQPPPTRRRHPRHLRRRARSRGQQPSNYGSPAGASTCSPTAGAATAAWS